MAGYLTTHVLDTARGMPGAGIAITLFALDGTRREIARAVTNADGRTDAPILPAGSFEPGQYELVFHCGPYLASQEAVPFLEDVPVRFGVSDPDAHYHVPLLLSPFGYTTYRGS